MIVLGIDPGQRTGLALYISGTLTSVSTATPAGALERIRELRPGLVVLEDSREQSAVFSRGVSPRAMLKIARNVGEIDHQCRTIVELCAELGIEVVQVSPLRKGAKYGANHMRGMCGWTARSNQHERDAAAVAWPYRHMRTSRRHPHGDIIDSEQNA